MRVLQRPCHQLDLAYGSENTRFVVVADPTSPRRPACQCPYSINEFQAPALALSVVLRRVQYALWSLAPESSLTAALGSGLN